MSDSMTSSTYRYFDSKSDYSHAYLLPTVYSELPVLKGALRANRCVARLFGLGCGNGGVGAQLAASGWSVTGVDPSPEGIADGRGAYPNIVLKRGSAYDDLASEYGTFPVVWSLEVVEKFSATLFDLVEPGGTIIVSTPYHGYLKNIALCVLGKWIRISVHSGITVI